MGLFDKLFGGSSKEQALAVLAQQSTTPPETPKVIKPRRPRKPKVPVAVAVPAAAPVAVPINSAKEAATLRGDPWVGVISVELDAENVGNGAFELDWNDKFLAQLVRAGFQRKPNEPESVIIDRWFQEVCRNVIMENFEQYEANIPRDPRGIQRKDLGDGRAEIG
jgi:hypothetical protein